MKLKQLVITIVLLSVILLVGCGQSMNPPSTQPEQDDEEETNIQAVQLVDADQKKPSTEWNVAASSVNQSEQVNPQEIIQLLEPISQVRREVIRQIEDNGWYQSIDEIEPSLQQFETAVRPIVTPVFTDRFIDEEILANMEAFFCYCDATGPMLGSMYPDLEKGFDQDGNQVTFEAFLPSDRINSGLKVEVTAIKVGDQWKVDTWQPLYSTHEKSFDLTIEQINAYYQAKGVQVQHLETITAPGSQEKVYLFEQQDSDQLIAIQAKDWLMMEGKERIEEFFDYESSTV